MTRTTSKSPCVGGEHLVGYRKASLKVMNGRRVRVSALALIKMAMHCRSGGDKEVGPDNSIFSGETAGKIHLPARKSGRLVCKEGE